MATKSSSKKSSSNVKSLSNKLASVSKQAKSLGINTSKADAMVAQTKSQGSKAFAGSSYEKDYEAGKYGAIPMNAMQNTDVPNLPEYPTKKDVGNLAGANMAGIESMLAGMDTVTGVDGSNEQLTTQTNKGMFDVFKNYLGLQAEPPKQADLYTDTYGVSQKQIGRDYRNARDEVQNQTASLNSILAKQQQDLLSVRGQGSTGGVTEAVYGGQQATINREAAIAALPVQAALMAAQGNLDEATRHLDNLFKLKSEDATAKYNYESKMVDSVFNFATTAQQNILTAKLADKKEQNDQTQSNINYLRDLTNTAIQNGRTGAISQLASIDPKSPTFNQDVARIAGGLIKPVGDGDGGGNGLTPAQINSTVNSIASAYDNEPIVKEYNTIKRNLDIYNGLGTSATDDIQRVYTFAKVADPNSAVKEGEYDSIEKYSQALLGRTGLKVSRVFTATGILTPEARTAMGKTLQTSLSAAEVGKNQVQAEYQRQIDDAYAGKNRTITEYTPPQPMGPVQPQNTDEIVYDEVVNNKQGYFSRLWGALLGN